jgi:hypothetical protein
VEHEHVPGPGEPGLQTRNQRRVELDRHDEPGAIGQRCGEDAGSGAELDDAIPRRNPGSVDQRGREPGASQEMLRPTAANRAAPGCP